MSKSRFADDCLNAQLTRSFLRVIRHFLQFLQFAEKPFDKARGREYNIRVIDDAAIAQSVERILGKDEVASSNLASSSTKVLEPQRFEDFSFFILHLISGHFPSLSFIFYPTIAVSRVRNVSSISGFACRSPIIFVSFSESDVPVALFMLLKNCCSTSCANFFRCVLLVRA